MLLKGLGAGVYLALQFVDSGLRGGLLGQEHVAGAGLAGDSSVMSRQP